MTLVFLYGALGDPVVMRALLGGDVAPQAAILPGAHLVATGSWLGPRLAFGAGEVPGQVVAVTPDQSDRVQYLAGVIGAELGAVKLADGRAATVLVPAGQAVGADDGWHARWAATAARAIADVMSFRGERPAGDVAVALPQILVRAASWARARDEATPMAVRTGFTDADVASDAPRRPYLKYFTLEEQDLRFALFDGGRSAKVERAAFVSGDAVTVLPYDAARDRVLVIEQFRFGPFVRGDQAPWSLEPIAGRIDPGESPETTARREAIEEAGLTLRDLLPVASYYPSPGAVSEYLFSYIGLADLPDSAARIGGLVAEAEDIRGVLLPFGALIGMLDSGEAQNGPLILSALWLAAHRDRLRASA
ncbi:MAG: NUDIX domain-containing protein [Rhodobacter sp.]|nr:NUDIX domain-containing protein [Rhodobacter sp.]